MTIYIIGVSLILRHGEKLFGEMNNFCGPIVFLLLFVLSAAISGALIFGHSAILYVKGNKIEAIRLFFCTVGWLAAATLIATLIAAAIQIVK